MKARTAAALLGGTALLAALILLLVPRHAVSATVWVDGEIYCTVDLSALTETVRIPVGEHNVLEAEYGRIRMLEADCPDGLCIGMGWTDSPAKPIVCLPNGVTVTVSGTEEERDAVIR